MGILQCSDTTFESILVCGPAARFPIYLPHTCLNGHQFCCTPRLVPSKATLGSHRKVIFVALDIPHLAACSRKPPVFNPATNLFRTVHTRVTSPICALFPLNIVRSIDDLAFQVAEEGGCKLYIPRISGGSRRKSARSSRSDQAAAM